MRVALRCDASPDIGTGHVVRSLALAEELLSRGHDVSFLGTTSDMAWPEDQIRSRGLPIIAAEPEADRFVPQARKMNLDAVVLDGYQLSSELGRALRKAGIAVMAMVDGPFGLAQHADLYVDQNFGAERRPRPVRDSVMLAGIEYALLRDVVVQRQRQPRPNLPVPRVLVVFGGSDPFGGARAVVPLVLDAVESVELSVIASNTTAAEELQQLTLGPQQRLSVLSLVDDLPGLALECTAAISAAGSSIWEFLCLGVPSGLVAVSDNQLVGYEQVRDAELAVPVGQLHQLWLATHRAGAVSAIRNLLTDAQLQASLTLRGQDTVDGRGRIRVADALEEAVARRR